ncbi:MAG: hypothetical protein KDC14_14960, partial [Planctomycetes bacterium]|nr:hypothetical protein [Planctomycetota bacterium]
KNFLERHGRAGAEAGDLTLDELVETEFLAAPIGVFELAIPRRNLATPSEPARFQGLCLNLLDAQELWLDWVRPNDNDTKPVRADLAAVRKWIEGWDTKQLAASASDGGLGFHELVESTPEEIESTERLRKSVCEGALMGGERKCEPVRVALFPSRADFVEMLCVVGYLRPNLQPYFWVSGLETWHQFNMTDMNLFGLAMSYPAEGVTGSTYSSGERMEEKNKNALNEQITQLALNAMVIRLYDDDLPGTVVHSLSINMVIESFGEIDTRADGHLEGRSTQAREAFVPGGQSQGGILPTASAKNRWRYDAGRFHYVRPLRYAQKDGSKERGRSKIKHANFVLRSEDGVISKLVYGPFLGSQAEGLPEPPKGLAEDQAEFLRAYRVAFIHWLREAGAGSKKASQAKFAEWLRELDSRAAIEDFEASLVTVYGVPLSSAELGKESLEGRFLLWLSKQKS